MKKVWVLVLAMVLVVGLSGQAWAQDAGAPKDAKVDKHAGKGPAGRPAGDRQFSGLMRLVFRLNTLELTAEQKTKVQALLDEVQKKITEEVLNPEQKAKLEQAPAEGGAKHGGGNHGKGAKEGAKEGGKEGGAPPPPPPPPQ
jgi:Spy/CpxP family protein refolding chaperone